MIRYTLPLLLLLAACATPREKCLSDASEDLRILDGLIAEQRVVVNRGFRMDRTLESRSRVQFCAGSGGNVSVRLCNGRNLRTVERPVAVDIPTEQRKLDQLVSRRDALASQTAQAQAFCPPA